MRSRLLAIALVLVGSLLAAAQTTPAAKPPSRTPVAGAAAEANPVAIIHTSVGDMHCTLFPKQAPIGVTNFIGLAEGTKDWTNPVSHAKKHGVALYDGTIFHRVIPEFMIQGGDPAGNGAGHERLAVLHHRRRRAQRPSDRQLHHLRPVRSRRHRVG